MPCCDVADHLDECIGSLLSQPFADWECLLVVEESRDATLSIARGYAEKDARFRVFTGPRSGSCSVPRNRGIEEARGGYIVFLDGDDYLAPGSLLRIHDAIAARPGADLYPCAIQVLNEITGRNGLRDNYPPDAPAELTGPEAILLAARFKNARPHPQLQLTVFRRAFLLDNALACIPGLRRQDSECSPRALYLARRVVPLHEPFYVYRIHPDSIRSRSRDPAVFLGDAAVILHSLLAFHARVSSSPGFDRRVAACWQRQWLSDLLFYWFHPRRIRPVPRRKRVETLGILFRNGFGDFRALAARASQAKRLACRWVELFVRHPLLRPAAEAFIALYFALSQIKEPWKQG